MGGGGIWRVCSFSTTFSQISGEAARDSGSGCASKLRPAFFRTGLWQPRQLRAMKGAAPLSTAGEATSAEVALPPAKRRGRIIPYRARRGRLIPDDFDGGRRGVKPLP